MSFRGGLATNPTVSLTITPGTDPMTPGPQQTIWLNGDILMITQGDGTSMALNNYVDVGYVDINGRPNATGTIQDPYGTFADAHAGARELLVVLGVPGGTVTDTISRPLSIITAVDFDVTATASVRIVGYPGIQPSVDISANVSVVANDVILSGVFTAAIAGGLNATNCTIGGIQSNNVTVILSECYLSSLGTAVQYADTSNNDLVIAYPRYDAPAPVVSVSNGSGTSRVTVLGSLPTVNVVSSTSLTVRVQSTDVTGSLAGATVSYIDDAATTGYGPADITWNVDTVKEALDDIRTSIGPGFVTYTGSAPAVDELASYATTTGNVIKVATGISASAGTLTVNQDANARRFGIFTGGTAAANYLTNNSGVLSWGTANVTINTAVQTLTNKTITDAGSNIAANSLKSATTIIDVSAAAAPTSGQVLRATSGTAASWTTLPTPVTFTGGPPATNEIAVFADSTGNVIKTPTGISGNAGTLNATILAASQDSSARRVGVFAGGSQTASYLTSAAGVLSWGTEAVTTNTAVQTLTNKTIIDATNNVAANSLKTVGSPVVVSGAAAPTTGQALLATSATTAAWGAPILTPSAPTVNTVPKWISQTSLGQSTVSIDVSNNLVCPGQVTLVEPTTASGFITVNGQRSVCIRQATNNVYVGPLVGNITGTGTGNVIVGGTNNGLSLTTGTDNACVGRGSGSGLTTATGNVLIGPAAGSTFSSGTNNVLIGNSAGSALTLGDSANIYLGAITGTAGESNTIRIGTGTQTRNFTAGIRGVTTGNVNAIPVLIDSAGQLGTISSSLAYKEDVAYLAPLDSEIIYSLSPAYFRYKGTPGSSTWLGLGGNPADPTIPPPSIGLIAEDVEGVSATGATSGGDLCVYDDPLRTVLYTVDYAKLPMLLLAEAKKTKTALDDAVADILDLAGDLSALAASHFSPNIHLTPPPLDLTSALLTTICTAIIPAGRVFTKCYVGASITLTGTGTFSAVAQPVGGGAAVTVASGTISASGVTSVAISDGSAAAFDRVVTFGLARVILLGIISVKSISLF